MGLIEPGKYGENFHELYTNKSDDRGIPLDRNSKLNKRKRRRSGNKQIFPNLSIANIELEPNASKFGIFAAIRSAVLEADTKYDLFQEKSTKKTNQQPSTCCFLCVGACKINNQVECSCHLSEKRLKSSEEGNSEDESDSNEITEKEVIAKVPQIVGAGLRSLCELIADARNVQPNLCNKALKALFDVIEGQQPESFKSEPENLINPLYDLLLDLSTINGPPRTTDESSSTTASSTETWSSIACSALLGLSVARGDTGKILKAVAALLMSPKILSSQNIQLPTVMNTLQRTVISAALNKPTKPDFHSHGIPKNSLIDQFSVKSILSSYTNFSSQPAMACDGTFLYLLVSNSLFKIGTGFNGTYKGHIYARNNDFGKDKAGWIGFYGNKLYFKRNTKKNDGMLIISTDSLSVTGSAPFTTPSIREGQNFLFFSDEDSINMIYTNRDDTLVVKQIRSSRQSAFELPLKLARKKFRTLGYAAFEDEVLNQNQIQKIQSSYNVFEPKLPNDIEIQGIACGKEFGIVRDLNGKIYYYGKSASLGLKSIGRTPTMKMTELIICKTSNIVQIAVGHDGVHALLVNDDGTVYFVGTARRGEDGDNCKNRRQPKPARPKKFLKIDGHVVIQAACNNGTSAFVTKTEKLIMFGKDTANCDSLGFVIDLMDQHITKIALGKAHCVALNSKGQLFTFGLNNKGQCGRGFPKDPLCSDSTDSKSSNNGRRVKFDFSEMCDFDDHTVVQGECKVCIVCKECTGYNVSCVSTLKIPMDERVTGAICPCGHGDAGCSKCGACSACIAIQENENSVIDGKDPKQLNLLNRQRSKSMIFRNTDKKIPEETSTISEFDTPRVAPLAPQRVVLPTNSPVVQIACGLHHTVVLTLEGEVFTFGSNQFGQLGTGDLLPVIGPVQVKIQGVNNQISQVAAGSNHTVLLTHKGVVYTFGNYQRGQLGRLPSEVIKTTINEETEKHSESPQKEMTASGIIAQRQKFLWNCSPGAVFGLGPSFGKKATWVGAGGDQTFIKIDESLITTQMLPKINIVADKQTILLIPTIPLTFHCLTISRRDGSCNAHYRNQVNFVQMIQSNPNAMPEINQNLDPHILAHQNQQDQMSRSMHEARNQIFDLAENQNERGRRHQEPGLSEKVMPQIAFALDSRFGVLWVFDGGVKKIFCYNVIASEIVEDNPNSSIYRALLAPEMSLPHKKESLILRSQASLNLLACLDILTSAQDSIPTCFEQETPHQTNHPKEFHLNDYQTVTRFENFGGGWGYSGHSVEAIRFSADSDVMICGFGMYGGRGEYSCKVKVFDLGPDGGGYEKDGILISETKEIPYECPPRSKYHIILPKPFTAAASRWYLVWARIAGPSSDCGSSGQNYVTTEDQVVFTFKSSKKANNGTDVNSGQIPVIIYKLITNEIKQAPMPINIDPVQKISKCFANTVTKECFESLVLLLNWSWATFKQSIKDQKDKTRFPQIKSSLEHLVYVNKSCLRLLRKYSNEIYPPRTLKMGQVTINSKKNGSCSSEINTQTYNIPKGTPSAPAMFRNANEMVTPTARKANMENIQLAECIGNVRALLIQILCDDIFNDIHSEDDYEIVVEILNECHTSFVACFDAFYPTSSLKWNCLCDLLSQMDKGTLHSRLLSAVLAGLCNPSVKLRVTFSLLTPGSERQSIISPSDNSGLPMLSSSENHQYPILVEQMIYRTQQEKIDFLSNCWTFKDVLVRLLEIISNPIKAKIENVYNRSIHFIEGSFGKEVNQGLLNNCCHLLTRVLAEIVYKTSIWDQFDATLIPPRSLHSTGSRFARSDISRTWNTGNFGPDAIAFTVDRPGIAIAGCMVYTGSGSYDYQLELLYDNTIDPTIQSQHKWETLESISGSYDQEMVKNDMTEIKFERPVHIKENTRYALRLCSQGARTCSGDSGLASLRGPCGTTFTFFCCDLSFNGTTPTRGQIPCILYYSTPFKSEGHITEYASEITARDTALQIATDITKKCTELLILARNALAASISPSDKSPNSSNHTQTIDSEHNITPIEEHMDVNWTIIARNSLTQESNLSTARDITKRIESFSKGIIETLKFDKRPTKNFDDFEIEIGATEINPKDLIGEELIDRNFKMGRNKLNGNDRTDNQDINSYMKDMSKSDSDDDTQLTIVQLLELFNINSSNMFNTLLPLVYAYIGTLTCSDPKSSVQILGLIKEILPHVAALNQLYASKDYNFPDKETKRVNRAMEESNKKKIDEVDRFIDMCTTSNHYCIVESDHPYKSAALSTYRVEFPPCVQWFTIEFDAQCGTAQLEDYLIISIPTKSQITEPCTANDDFVENDNNMCSSRTSCKNASIISSCYNKLLEPRENFKDMKNIDSDWIIIKKYNTQSHWSQNSLVLPGNRVEFSLETATLYAPDQKANKFGFKCSVVGYDNPISLNAVNACLIRLEQELAYLGGMCSANLMKKDLNLPDDKSMLDVSGIEETLNAHQGLLSKGLAISDSVLNVNQALESYLSVGSRSNERQFLKDFISGAPGSSGARLAAWLQPEPRLDPNRCELNPVLNSLRYGWPTQLVVTIRDQYGDAVIVPNLRVEIKAVPVGAIPNGKLKFRRTSYNDINALGGMALPPRINYEPVVKDKSVYKAITFMKSYSQYSFEELRFCSPNQTRVTETLFPKDMDDGTFSVHWTPNSIGNYCLTVTVDGISLEDIYRVEVKEGGGPPPNRTPVKKANPPSKLRKFIAKNSAGLRIRSHPTLQSEQVGIVKMNGIISFIDEIENDDGIWVRLSTISIREHCSAGWYPTEAWCLQYNQHLGKTLLYPLLEQNPTKPAILKKKPKITMLDNPEIASAEPTLKTVSSSPIKKNCDSPKDTPPQSAETISSSMTNPFLFSSSNKLFESDKSDEINSDKRSIDDLEANSQIPIEPLTSSGSDPSKRYQPTAMSQDDSNSTPSSSPSSNLGSAIAGVVGGGASKLQALQKWFKGDSVEGKENQRRRNEDNRKPTEISSVCVKDLVRAIGAQESRSNGNNENIYASTIAVNSSPVQVPTMKQIAEEQSICSSSSKSVEDTSALVSSITRDVSHSPSHSSTKDDISSSTKFHTDTNSSHSEINAVASAISKLNYFPSTPKHTSRRSKQRKIIPTSGTSTPAGLADSSNNEKSLSVNIKTAINTQQNVDQKTGSTDTSSPPVWPPAAPHQFANSLIDPLSMIKESASATKILPMGPPKRAMPPSLVESLRAAFAAILWHEGIVHDAMACASFLKFHPNLPKEGASVVSRRGDAHDESNFNLSKEQKAQQRHSVEVANAGNYLNIRPSTLETLTKSGVSSINNRRFRKGISDIEFASEKTKLHSLPEMVAVLPPALKCLVYLWEQLCINCAQVAQISTEQPKLISPKFYSSKEKIDNHDRENQKLQKVVSTKQRVEDDDESWCEFCEIVLPIPVTYHMRIVHPGCGKPAKGKGYNKSGLYCDGWAGNCGEGGNGSCCWFIMCQNCREKYISQSKNINNLNNSSKQMTSQNDLIYNRTTYGFHANSEIYSMMKDNAMFLLELSASHSQSSHPLTATQQKRSPQQMPIVTEGQINIFADINKPSTSRGGETSQRNSRIGLKMNAGKFNPFPITPSRKSFPNCNSPDSMWLAPEVFSCLESLGASLADDMPYEIFGINSGENIFERPLSEVSFDSCDQHNSDLMTTSGATHGTSTLSKFHRSFSMVQGWSNHLQQKSGMTVYPANFDENTATKVVMRRKRTSTNEAEGSLMLCYPSENLRKLVPENVLSTSFIVPTYNNSCPPPPPPPPKKLEEEKKLTDKKLSVKSDQSTSNSITKECSGSTKLKHNDKDITLLNPKDHCIDMEPNLNYLLNRPTMTFITQPHDIEKLRYVMKRSLRIAACRIYSMQALNWMLRSVTQTCCLHDLMWWFVSALSNSTYEELGPPNFKNDDNELALEHPVSHVQMSGRISQNVTHSLHTFLQSVADLTLLLPGGSSLQRMAIQCFGIKFRQADHQFLHSAHVFGNISKILSKSDEQNEAMLVSSIVAMSESNAHMLDQTYGASVSNAGAKLFNYTDLSGMFEITVSSRVNFADTLIDNSTETFWESDEDDRNKCKIIEISMNRMNYVCKAVFAHIDNTRDVQSKVLNIVFYAGQSLGDTNLIKAVDIDPKVCTWVSAKIPDESFTHFRLELRGPDNSLRVRQIKLLGVPTTADDFVIYGKPNLKLSNATQIQQRICELETLRVFRLITAQVFGKLISTPDNTNENINWVSQGPMMESSANSMLADSLDLREHMVGILFSRSKLSHLQKQVIVHIVYAIKKEAQRAKEEWEMSNAVANFKDTHTGADQKSDSSVERYRSPDTYCFEMLSMVLALSGSAVGRSYLSHQHGLLKDLLSLLHTGSDRVQRQVTALLRRILPEISPESLGDLLGVQDMPPTDFNIVNQNPGDFDMNRLGILDIFLAVIAKSLQLQVKIKTTIKPNIDKSPAFVKLCNSIDFSVHTLKKKEITEVFMEDKNTVEIPPQFTFDTGPVVKGFTMDLSDFERNPKKQLKEAVSKNLNQRWFLKGTISSKQAESIIALIRDMTGGKLTEKWSLVTKAAIAESVLNLTRLDEIFRSPENCVKTSTLWLAIASLCVLDKDHVEKLSSGQWSNSDTRPLCTNHDDGETSAIIQCETCGSLCSDCDRFLHLSRKTRHHRRTVCKEEEEAIRVELHESCGRTKLFWLLALADSKTLKAVVEFRDGNNTIISGPHDTVGRCRFCGVTGNTGLLEIGNVCADALCQELAANSCQRIKSCGHSCGGVIGEQKCLPCLQHVCHDKENQLAESSKLPKLTQDADDMCMICFVEALACAPSIQLECGHVFHFHCCKTVLEKRWIGPRISFGFSLCPICKTDIQHDLLANVLEPINSLKEDVKKKALMRVKYEGLIKSSDTKNLTALAMDRYAYYVCFKCQKAYYGGEARCDAEIGDKFNPEELVCGACSDVARAQMCPKHGTDYLEYKCRYCCSVAVFFCFGTTHFCDTCHDDFQHLTNIPKNKLPQCPCGPRAKQLAGEECPLHVNHPPTGEEFALGCGICRNAHTF